MIAPNVSTNPPWAVEPTAAPTLDGFNHRLTIGEARRRLFGEAPILRIGRYRIESRIGAGGMGEVYLAVDEQLDRKVAIKRVLPGLISERHHERLRDEARALAKLSHPNVVQVYEIGEHDQRTFLAMEYVEGQTLAQWLAEEPRPWREILTRFCACGRGLAAAHEAGVIHRDFKPENILLGKDGSVRVADFGIALAEPDPEAIRALGDNLETGMTHYVAGTFRYMPLEQLLGNCIDARSDQFAFCVALYEALWSSQPFTMGTVHERLEALAFEHAHKPARRAGVPAAVWRIIRRGLARAPQDRWPDMATLVDALASAPCRRRRALFTGFSVTMASAMVLASALLPAKVQPTKEADQPTATAPFVIVEPEVELARGPGRERPGSGARLWITTDELRFAELAGVESQHLIDLDEGRIPADRIERHMVRALYDQIRANQPSEHDSLTLFVDHRVPWTTIVDVLFSSGRAGYTRWDFALATDDGTRVLTAKPPMYSIPEVQLARLAMMQLRVTTEQVEVSTQIARPMDPQSSVVRALDLGEGSCAIGRDRLDSLRPLSTKLCELSGVAIPVWITAEESIRWADVVEVLGPALSEGICDGGIVVSSDTRPDDCDTPTRLAALDELLGR